MDFFNQRGSQPKQHSNPAMPASSHSESHGSHKRRHKGIAVLRITAVVLLFSVTILIVALLVKLVVGGPKKEADIVDTSKYQAVFLTGNQVYFGKITSLNDKYVSLQDIYYLKVNQQVQPKDSTSSSTGSDVTLAKLGIELHCPEDRMTINKDQVTFWENLQDDGQVVKAIKAFKDNNKDGVKCSQGATSNSSSSSSNKAGQ